MCESSSLTCYIAMSKTVLEYKLVPLIGRCTAHVLRMQADWQSSIWSSSFGLDLWSDDDNVVAILLANRLRLEVGERRVEISFSSG
jgi:hypothetical protein